MLNKIRKTLHATPVVERSSLRGEARYTLHNKKGFSLIELLVVIAIIGILSTVIGVNYSTSKKVARDAKRKADIENVAAALEMYYSEFKKYPTNVDSWDSLATTLKDYITTMPEDPLNNDNYEYCNTNEIDGTKFSVWAYLEAEKNALGGEAPCGQIQNGSGVYTNGGKFYYRVVGK